MKQQMQVFKFHWSLRWSKRNKRWSIKFCYRGYSATSANNSNLFGYWFSATNASNSNFFGLLLVMKQQMNHQISLDN
jgi:hypothetical protein